VTFAFDWVTGVLEAFVFFIFVVTEMWSLSGIFWIVIAVEGVFTFDGDATFVFTFHSRSTMFVTMTCSFHFTSVFIQKTNDTFVFETISTVFVVWVSTVLVCFAFFENTFFLFTLASAGFTQFTGSAEFFLTVFCFSTFL